MPVQFPYPTDNWSTGFMRKAKATRGLDPSREYRELEGVRKEKETKASELQFSPQEQFLYQHHMDNLQQGGIQSKEGTSTTLGTTVEIDGRHYVLPTVWKNKRLSVTDSVNRAKEVGLDKFPSYDSEEEAQRRYNEMHQQMNKDVEQPSGPGPTRYQG